VPQKLVDRHHPRPSSPISAATRRIKPITARLCAVDVVAHAMVPSLEGGRRLLHRIRAPSTPSRIRGGTRAGVETSSPRLTERTFGASPRRFNVLEMRNLIDAGPALWTGGCRQRRNGSRRAAASARPCPRRQRRRSGPAIPPPLRPRPPSSSATVPPAPSGPDVAEPTMLGRVSGPQPLRVRPARNPGAPAGHGPYDCVPRGCFIFISS